jgi:quercetin dioxygenase-like cupin family protein
MFCTDIDEKTMCRTRSGNNIYWLITQENGAPNFELRYIEIPVGGKSSASSHAHEHEVFVIRGEGKVVGREANGSSYEKALVPGLAVFIPGDEEHQWLNTEHLDGGVRFHLRRSQRRGSRKQASLSRLSRREAPWAE